VQIHLYTLAGPLLAHNHRALPGVVQSANLAQVSSFLLQDAVNPVAAHRSVAQGPAMVDSPAWPS
jgi:hypothetical protein